MKRRKRILLAALLVAILGGLVWAVIPSGPPEPMYEGKRLSYWLENYDPRHDSGSLEAAVRQAGTNAIPTLLRFLQINELPRKLKFYAMLDKLPFVKIKHSDVFNLRWKAALGFRVLGADASSALPALIEMYERNDTNDSRVHAVGAMGAIGPPAKAEVPMLLNGLTNSTPAERRVFVQALGEIHSDPELVVPVLIAALGDPRYGGRRSAVEALGRYWADAKPAVPALVKLLDDSDINVRYAAARALRQIDPEAAAKAGVK